MDSLTPLSLSRRAGMGQGGGGLARGAGALNIGVNSSIEILRQLICIC